MSGVYFDGIPCEACGNKATRFGSVAGYKDGKETLLMKFHVCAEHYKQIIDVVEKHGKRLKIPTIKISGDGKN